MRLRYMLAFALLWPSIGLAGTGPWTLQAREHNVYLGTDYFRYGRFNGALPNVTLDTEIVSAGLTGVWTFGMAYGLEGEVVARFEGVRVADPRPALCNEGVPADWCDPTSGLGDVAARLKWQVVDEAYGFPLSWAFSVGTRTGEAYAPKRGRLTTLGDGSTDVGGGVSLGRTGVLGRAGWYRFSTDAYYWYRFPSGQRNGQKVPSDEVTGEIAMLLAPNPRFGFGPAVAGFTRIGGIDLNPPEADFGDPDFWNSLAATQLKVGGKLGVYSIDNGPTVSVSALWTVYARNNPRDTFALSVGIGQWFAPRGD